LVLLTVAAVVTNPFENLLAERLAWLDTTLGLLDPRNPDLGADILPRILSVIQGRLQEAYMKMSENNPSDPMLRTMAMLSRRATDLKTMHENVIRG
jgi:hypothetical protein